MRHVFIVNPISGKGYGLQFIPIIEKYFSDNGGQYEIIQTEYVHHATELANKYSESDDVTLYAVGGDGTMKEVLDGINEKVILCIIPGGTGNDFYKSIDLKKKSAEQIIKENIEGEIIDADYGILNGKSRFLNICSFGLDADINEYSCEHVKKNTKIPNSLVYAYSAFKVGLHPASYHMNCRIDDKEVSDDVVMFACSNGKFYGGVFCPSPFAQINDGKLNVCYFRDKLKTLRLINLILKYTKGKHLSQPECFHTEATRIELSFDREINYQIDGERGRLQKCTIDICPKAIKLKIPKERSGKNE